MSPAKKKTAPKKAAGDLSLSLGEIFALYNTGLGNPAAGFLGLSGFNKAVGDRTIVVPYSFLDEVRQNITRNKFKLRPFVEEIGHMRSMATTKVTVPAHWLDRQ